jgi:hypothetical protein
MAALDTVTIKGKSGTGYIFDVYDFSQAFKQVGAVYTILKYEIQPGTTSWWYKYVYVGETGDLSTRFYDHHKEECFQREGANRIAIQLDSSEKSRKDKETDILNGGTWPCNG